MSRRSYHLIVAYDLHRGIGQGGKLPWKEKEDLERFRQITEVEDSCVVMGRKTWDSLPESKRPLPNRLNVVISRNPPPSTNKENLIWLSDLNQLDQRIPETFQQVFFIGGNQLFLLARSHFRIDTYYLTQILKEYPCDIKLPDWDLTQYQLINSETVIGQTSGTPIRFQIYARLRLPEETHPEYQYLDLLRRTIQMGSVREDRTKVGTLSLFEGNQLKFDLQQGFPLLTTKRVFWRGVVEELLFFLSGRTDVKYLQEKGVHIWDGNSTREYLNRIGQSHRQAGDLGKIYGFQWRHWGAKYIDSRTEYRDQGLDQINLILDLIRRTPTSRRILITSWNPSDLNEMALPACHLIYQFYVDIERHQLSCLMYQRSADIFLGLPFNIASTALLTHLIAHTCGLQPGKIIITLGDTHLYLNHIQAALEQLKRTPNSLPKLRILVKRNRLEDYRFEDLNLINYCPQLTISAKMAV